MIYSEDCYHDAVPVAVMEGCPVSPTSTRPIRRAAKPSAVIEPTGASIEQLIEEYLDEKRAINLSALTVEQSYGYSLKGVLMPLLREKGITDPADVTQPMLSELARDMLSGKRAAKGKPLAERSVKSYLGAINLFLNWLGKRGDIGDVRARPPRVTERLPETLNGREIQKVEDAARNERDRLIVRVLADTGLRVSELVPRKPKDRNATGLRLKDVLKEDRHFFLKVMGKGRREREVSIERGLYQRIQTYVKGDRAALKSDSDFLFLSHKRSAATREYEPLTTSGVLQLIGSLATSAEISKRVYPHILRHSYITRLVAQGASPILLAREVGHSSTAMIDKVYAHNTPAQRGDHLLALLVRERERD